jgi:hypothetical protein
VIQVLDPRHPLYERSFRVYPSEQLRVRVSLRSTGSALAEANPPHEFLEAAALGD